MKGPLFTASLLKRFSAVWPSHLTRHSCYVLRWCLAVQFNLLYIHFL